MRQTAVIFGTVSLDRPSRAVLLHTKLLRSLPIERSEAINTEPFQGSRVLRNVWLLVNRHPGTRNFE